MSIVLSSCIENIFRLWWCQPLSFETKTVSWAFSLEGLFSQSIIHQTFLLCSQGSSTKTGEKGHAAVVFLYLDKSLFMNVQDFSDSEARKQIPACRLFLHLQSKMFFLKAPRLIDKTVPELISCATELRTDNESLQHGAPCKNITQATAVTEHFPSKTVTYIGRRIGSACTGQPLSFTVSQFTASTSRSDCDANSSIGGLYLTASATWEESMPFVKSAVFTEPRMITAAALSKLVQCSKGSSSPFLWLPSFHLYFFKGIWSQGDQYKTQPLL